MLNKTQSVILTILSLSIAYAQPKLYRLESLTGLDLVNANPVNAKREVATYRGRRAIHVVDKQGTLNTIAAVLTDSDF